MFGLEISLSLILLVVAITFLSSALQGMAGFGSAMFLINSLVLFGDLELAQAIPISIVASGAQNLLGYFKLKSELEIAECVKPALIRFVWIPIGAALLWYGSGHLDRGLIKQILGCFLLAIVAAQIILKPSPQEKLTEKWTWIAFSLSGFLLGSVGMCGPPMVLWVMSHKWSPAKSRGFLFTMFLTGIVPHAFIYWWLFPESFNTYAVIGLMSLPAIFAGAWLGISFGNLLPKEKIRFVMFALLITMGVANIFLPIIKKNFVTATERATAQVLLTK
ncbi:MAG: sulfite exporter TauE/SafE family protein [Pirellulaceae bacterium]|nr:sulfite exporter TauE/SafE family protein [Pirellulaceae bacterium]